MTGQVVVSLHRTRLELTTAPGDFLAFACSYLAPLLDQTDTEPEIKIALEWNATLPVEHSTSEQLGRRIWVADHRLRYDEIWQVPGLQMGIDWEDMLTVQAAYEWPSRRAKWFSRIIDPVQKKLFVLLIYYLVYFPCAWWLERKMGWTLVHASAIATPEGGLVFNGLPGCGKSTIALALLSQSTWQVVSDNLLFTDGSRVFACPEPIHVDEQTRDLVGDLGGRVHPTGRGFSHRRQDYEIGSQARQQSTTPCALGFLHVGRETNVRLIDQTMATQRLMANDYLAKEWMAYQESAAAMHQVWPQIGNQEQRRRNLTSLARSIPCYEVTVARGGDLRQAMEAITGTMLLGR
jgi:hypothetical protein